MSSTKELITIFAVCCIINCVTASKPSPTVAIDLGENCGSIKAVPYQNLSKSIGTHYRFFNIMDNVLTEVCDDGCLTFYITPTDDPFTFVGTNCCHNATSNICGPSVGTGIVNYTPDEAVINYITDKRVYSIHTLATDDYETYWIMYVCKPSNHGQRKSETLFISTATPTIDRIFQRCIIWCSFEVFFLFQRPSCA